MPFKRAAVIVAPILLAIWVLPASAASPFTQAYGTFNDAQNAIDGSRTTSAVSTGTPYRGEYFLIVSFPQPSLIRNVKVNFEGKAPKEYRLEMSNDAMTWSPVEMGEKAKSIKFRMAASAGETVKISEIECNSEVAVTGPEPFMPISLSVGTIETTAATLNIGFTKPVRLSINYGFEADENSMKNFLEYTSYQNFYQVSLTDLVEGLDYYIRVKAMTADGELFVTTDTEIMHFRLLGTPPLRVVAAGVGAISPLSVSLVVQTNIPSHCVYYFGEGERFTSIVSQPGYDTRHVFDIKDLSPNRLYNYMAFLTDFRGMNVVLPKTQITTSEVNIARKKPVIEGTFKVLREPGFQGGTATADSILQRITDGRNDYFEGMAHSGDLNNFDQYAVIDLGRVYTLESHATVWRQLAFPKYYEIFTSLDNKTWEKGLVQTGGRIDNAMQLRSGSGDPLIATGGTFDGTPKARYVKLFIPKGSPYYKKHRGWNNVDLAELKIYPGGDYAEIKRVVREEWQP